MIQRYSLLVKLSDSMKRDAGDASFLQRVVEAREPRDASDSRRFLGVSLLTKGTA
jgi:hypothetical protein